MKRVVLPMMATVSVSFDKVCLCGIRKGIDRGVTAPQHRLLTG